MALAAHAREAREQLLAAQARVDMLDTARATQAELDELRARIAALEDWAWCVTTVLALRKFAVDAPQQAIPAPRRAPVLETVMTQRKRTRADAQARYSARQREAT